MVSEDFHVHSDYSDGENTLEELAEAAVARGMTRLGISDHSFTSFDPAPCVPPERLEERRRALAALREQYRGRLELYCGIEQDLYSDLPAEGYDYVIGSVHYLLLDGTYYSVDEDPAQLSALAHDRFDDDIYALTECYFRTVAQTAERTLCRVIGHFDLISKFNEKHPLFSVRHPRYIAAWHSAADTLLKSGALFEINTGAMSRGWTTSPYPAEDILRYLSDRGAAFVLSSDSHSAKNLCYDFENQEKRARALGLRLGRVIPD